MAANDPLPTVVIVSPKDTTKQAIINEMDYDETKHVLWDERDKVKPVASKIPFMSPERQVKDAPEKGATTPKEGASKESK